MDIKLKAGEKVTVNGYQIRAVGLVTKAPDQLQISKAGMPNIWGGLGDDVVTGYAIIIGDKPKELPEIVTQHFGNLTRKEKR